MNRRKANREDEVSYRLEYAMKYCGYRSCDICEEAETLGFPMGSSTISQYLSGKYTPKQDKIILLSRILGVPELWLMGVTPLEDIAGNSLKDYSNPIESTLLSDFRSLNKSGKELIIRLIQVVVNTNEYKRTNE